MLTHEGLDLGTFTLPFHTGLPISTPGTGMPASDPSICGLGQAEEQNCGVCRGKLLGLTVVTLLVGGIVWWASKRGR